MGRHGGGAFGQLRRHHAVPPPSNRSHVASQTFLPRQSAGFHGLYPGFPLRFSLVSRLCRNSCPDGAAIQASGPCDSLRFEYRSSKLFSLFSLFLFRRSNFVQRIVFNIVISFFEKITLGRLAVASEEVVCDVRFKIIGDGFLRSLEG